MSDDHADDVRIADIVPTTIRELANVEPHCMSAPATRSREEEFTVYEVSGVIREVKPENDRDLHLILEDPDNASSTMVAEIVDPRCPGANTSVLVQQLKNARDQFEELLGGGPYSSLRGEVVRVRGVGFFDRSHGQTGMAQSCLELHPVLSIAFSE
jgi:hypothetical protein